MLAACVFNDEYNFHLNDDVSFRILPGKCSPSDMRSFTNTLKAFSFLRFQHKTVNDILTIIAAILHLGNIAFTFSETGKCSVDYSNKGKKLKLVSNCQAFS